MIVKLEHSLTVWTPYTPQITGFHELQHSCLRDSTTQLAQPGEVDCTVSTVRTITGGNTYYDILLESPGIAHCDKCERRHVTEVAIMHMSHTTQLELFRQVSNSAYPGFDPSALSTRN